MRHLSTLALLAVFGAAACSASPRGPGAADATTSVAHRAHASDAEARGTRTEGPVAGSITGYSLDDLPTIWRDQAGAEVRLAEVEGEVRLLALVYTSCSATCPLIVADLKQVEASLPAERRADVRFVLVSLDPERDTPGRLAEWAASTGLDPARWTLLAGSEDAVRELAAAVGVRYQALPGGEMAHTNVITVLDRDGGVAHQQIGLGAPARATVAAVHQLLR